MTDHFSGIFRRSRPILGEEELQAMCPEHGPVSTIQPASQQGLNAVVTEARAHDDVVHGVYRNESSYLLELNHHSRTPSSSPS